jgi:YHS domain.
MCPGSGEELQVSMKTLRVVQKHGQAVYFCCNGCLTGFWAAPEKYLEMSAENTIIL